MSEPDHLWLKPMPNLMKGSAPGGQAASGGEAAAEGGAVGARQSAWAERAGSVGTPLSDAAGCCLPRRGGRPARPALPRPPLRPLLAPCCRAAAFPFFYIEPSKKEYRSIVSKFVGPVTVTQAEQIAPIGERGGEGAARPRGAASDSSWLPSHALPCLSPPALHSASALNSRSATNHHCVHPRPQATRPPC